MSSSGDAGSDNEGRYLLHYKNEYEQDVKRELLSIPGLKIVKDMPMTDFYLVEVPAQITCTQLEKVPEVTSCAMERRHVLSPPKKSEASGDPSSFSLQATSDTSACSSSTEVDGELRPWGYTATQSDSALLAEQITADMLRRTFVCVLDTGVQAEHPDLQGVNGYNGTDIPSPWNKDVVGHGTHVSGTIGANAGNALGVVGMTNTATSVYMVNPSVTDSSGNTGFDDSNIIEALAVCEAHLQERQAVDPSTRMVVSMSLGRTLQNGETDSPPFYAKFQQLGARSDVLLVAAAGNDNNATTNADLWSSPAVFAEVMSVAALDCNLQVAQFSQRNDDVEIAGPGVSILSTYPQALSNDGYAELDGTSMATPHVSGIAARLWARFPDCTATELRQALASSAKDLGAPGRDREYGYGFIQAEAAYNMLAQMTCGGSNSSTSSPPPSTPEPPSSPPPPYQPPTYGDFSYSPPPPPESSTCVDLSDNCLAWLMKYPDMCTTNAYYFGDQTQTIDGYWCRETCGTCPIFASSGNF